MNDISYPEFTHIVKKLNMDISIARSCILGTDWNYPDVCSPFTRIYIPLSGEGFIETSEGPITLRRGKIYIVPAMYTFSCRCDDRLEKLFYHVSLLGEEGFDLFSKVPRCLVLDVTDSQIEQDIRLIHDTTIRGALEMKIRIANILLSAIRQYNISFGDIAEHSPITSAALSYIKENLSATLSIADVANALFTSRLTLQSLFKKEINMPIGKYIDDCCLIEANNLLANSKLSVKEISDHLGFCDQFYFSRKFREKYGLSPQKYRKLIFPNN